MSIDLQKLIEEEELMQDCEKLKELNHKLKLDKIINNVRDKFANNYNDMNDLDIIYKFAEAIKRHI